ncbi:hypothetical protein SOCE26_048850 [Sorangium cellulosum]|uniref:Uncharacterized protein n=1 Tax=Sorangium cellulosum TaxID=56 RepID=A0A2L0EVV5_SORCE|nr:hypothetical protein [Sorangium cellulosum]AUX43437.1 hypothetical protein SOCE26_048850 [Sorangium cellulosum]
MSQDKPFSRKAFINKPDLTGARWWQDELQADPDPFNRRNALKSMLWIGGGVLSAGLLAGLVLTVGDSDDPGMQSAVDALELQREEGWDVGAMNKVLHFPGAVSQDARGQTPDGTTLRSLSSRLAPTQAELKPYYVPTLFQAATDPNNAALLTQVRPVDTPEMDAAFDKARALLSLFQEASSPRDIALVVDLPGPQAVAFAAALAELFEPVFLFDNWPHPAGVVPSHLVLGAALFYAPLLAESAPVRPRSAPPLFVVDSQRLNPYTDDPNTFDNRYVARLPSAERLKALGVKHVLYINDQAGPELQEADDLNEDIVAYQAAGVDTKLLSLHDFSRASSEDLAALASGPFAAPSQSAAVAPPVRTGVPLIFFYGGSYLSHPAFWGSYGWYSTPRSAYAMPPVRPLSRGADFAPKLRPTVFSSRAVGGAVSGVGKQKPSGFGRVSSSSSYHPSAPSYTGGRSGSFGRGVSFGA